MICDEAHKSVPSVDKKQAKDNVFAKCHDNDFLKANKRLYMTATPKVPKIKKNKDPQEIEFLSMDDEEIFGKEIFYYGFGQAIAEKRLCDYKVLVLMTDTKEIADIVNIYNKKHHLKEEAHKKVQAEDEIDYEFVAKILGMYKALSRFNIQVLDTTNNQNSTLVDLGDTATSKQAISFSTFKSTSKKITNHANKLIEYYKQLYTSNLAPFDLEIDHIDGEMNATTRTHKLERLSHKADSENTCKILSNARCLSEGVDVPSLDSVIFFDSKESKIDIAQSIGRAIRLDKNNPNKTHGYIILPVAYSNEYNRSLNEYVKSTSFRVVWEVLGALRSIDDRFIADNIYIAPPMSERSSSGEKTKTKPPKINFEEGFRLAQKLHSVIAEKIGDSLYWENFGKKAATKIEPIKTRLRDIDRKTNGVIITDFLKVLRENIHHNIDKTQSLDMLASHLILNPIYKSILGHFDEPISKALEEQIAKLKKEGLNEGETKDLKDYYEEVERQAKSAKSDSNKLKLLNALHEAFIDGVYKKEKQKHGINLTPLEIIDFLLHSTNFLLSKHFNLSFEDKEVKILDPFTGTGAFISRLLSQENAFFQKENIFEKANDFYAQEIMLLSYHTAILKITQTLQEYDKNALLFKNVILCDSLDYLEEEAYLKEQAKTLFKDEPTPLSENKKLKDKVAQNHIAVICSHPPYRGGQRDANDNNANLKHPNLEKEVKKAYTGGFNNNEGQTTRSAYIQAIFMATQKIGHKGIVSFVVGNGFLDSKSGIGFRKRLLEDFNELYIVDLKGDLRSQRQHLKENEGENILDIQSGVCLFLGVKNPSLNTHKLYYYDIGDNLKKKDKLRFLTENKSLQNLTFTEIMPNAQYDWLNQRNSEEGKIYSSFVSLGKSANITDTLFNITLLGVKTNRDDWVYNFSLKTLQNSIETSIETYRNNLAEFDYEIFKSKIPNNIKKSGYHNLLKNELTTNGIISWTEPLKKWFLSNRNLENYDSKYIRVATYRPFVKTNLYYNKEWNEAQREFPKLFPKKESENKIILIAKDKDFSVLMCDNIVDLHTMGGETRVYPLYTYENGTQEYAISKVYLNKFREHYNNNAISYEDIFYYTYGILHHKDFLDTYKIYLQKEDPKIPLSKDFNTISELGKKLANLHLNYETSPLKHESFEILGDSNDPKTYEVEKMKFKDKTTKECIIYNHHITITDIPSIAFDYKLCGDSVVESYMKKMSVKISKKAKNKEGDFITDNPNDFKGGKYIFETFLRVIALSIKSVELIEKISHLSYE
ncbi:type ISP restriction/modification enzyme [Helicobacter cetorum]|uniref:type ISP restriction/modification enzyme n=1 Tax=Helicobacter cetorum TaxID=138563 RepID=UPI000CF04B69|nr:type ISP restriction/modification enzyme [Helicobacter cetorum]